MIDYWCQNKEELIMTIEIADRLVKLRKKYGYSQEELADKLGLSRQAVSKWERAEASPDTDNLICLAKLYGVSLDELLATDEDVDTIVKEQVKDKEETKAPEEEQETADEVTDDEPNTGEKKGDRVEINDHGIFVTDEDGSRVVINKKGVHCYDSEDRLVKKVEKPDHRAMAILGTLEGLLFILATVAYILLGSLLGMWHNGWVVFFVPEIICSIVRCIVKKNAHNFNMPFAAVFTFFFVCMVLPGLDANLWHPMWVVFLAIPVYYTAVSLINKAIGKEKIECHVKINGKDDFVEEPGVEEIDDD